MVGTTLQNPYMGLQLASLDHTVGQTVRQLLLLLKVVQASQLLGARCVLTGINPAVAQTLVEIGADLSTVKTLRNLKAGLLDCLKFMRQSGAAGKEA